VRQPDKQPVFSKKTLKVYEFLQSESTLVVSTKDADGRVHSAPLFYSIAENLDLVWISSAKSRHSVSIGIEPDVAIAVFRSTFEWRKIVGVQMHGTCSIIAGAERKPILEAYCLRFQLGSVSSFAIARSLVYRFHPHWVRFIDNQKRFGYKLELDL